MKSNHLFMLLGYPGSGKTYFSEQLAKDSGAIRLNADAMRVATLGTIEKAREFNDDTGLQNSIVFGALDYAVLQILKSGNSVICDYQHNER
jgi:predicted kinase